MRGFYIIMRVRRERVKLNSWRLSSDLFARQAFRMRLQSSSQHVRHSTPCLYQGKWSNFIISVSVHVCVYDVGCFVDVLASRSGYCVRNLVFQ